MKTQPSPVMPPEGFSTGGIPADRPPPQPLTPALIPPGPPTASSSTPPEAALSERIREVNKQLDELRDLKGKLAEYNFQTITIILGVLTIATVVPFALLHSAQVSTSTVGDAIFAVLVADTLMAGIWMVLWCKLNFFRHSETKSKLQTTQLVIRPNDPRAPIEK